MGTSQARRPVMAAEGSSGAWIAGRVVGINAAGLDYDGFVRAADLAAAFAGFQAVHQQVNGDFFEWLDDPADVGDAELIARTERICRDARVGAL